jgi:hypothetical protein
MTGVRTNVVGVGMTKFDKPGSNQSWSTIPTADLASRA